MDGSCKQWGSGREQLLVPRLQNGGKTWAAWKSTGSTKASITRKKKLRFAVQISAVNSAGQGTIAQVSLKKY